MDKKCKCGCGHLHATKRKVLRFWPCNMKLKVPIISNAPVLWRKGPFAVGIIFLITVCCGDFVCTNYHVFQHTQVDAMHGQVLSSNGIDKNL